MLNILLQVQGHMNGADLNLCHTSFARLAPPSIRPFLTSAPSIGVLFLTAEP